MSENPQIDQPEQGEMSFLQHLEALRWHLVRAISSMMIFAAVAFVFKGFIFDTILLGPKRGDFWTYQQLCKIADRLNLPDLCINGVDFDIINISMAGQFTTHIVVSIIAGLIMAFPYVVYELWSFIKPGLYDQERKVARGMVFYVSFLFIVGVLFGYYIISPLSVNFLGSYNVSSDIRNQIDLNSYFSTVSTLVLACGVVFEMPILVYFLTKIGVITPEFLRTYRRHAIVVVLILSAIITPPDVSSQVLIFFPLMGLYEISIWVSALVLKRGSES